MCIWMVKVKLIILHYIRYKISNQMATENKLLFKLVQREYATFWLVIITETDKVIIYLLWY